MDKSLVTSGLNLVQDLEDAIRLAQIMYESGLFDVKSAQQAVVLIIAGAEVGIPAFQAMRSLYVEPRSGKVEMHATLMAALIKKSGRYDYRITELTDDACTVVYLDNGKDFFTSRFTMADAIKANIHQVWDKEKNQWKEQPAWKKYPRNMLFARTMSNGFKFATPELGSGIYGVGEISERPQDEPTVVDGTGEVIEQPKQLEAEIHEEPVVLPAPPEALDKWTLTDDVTYTRVLEYLQGKEGMPQVPMAIATTYANYWKANPSKFNKSAVKAAADTLLKQVQQWLVFDINKMLAEIEVTRDDAKAVLNIGSFSDLLELRGNIPHANFPPIIEIKLKIEHAIEAAKKEEGVPL